MKKTELKIQLSQIKGFENPKISLEQYMTPPELAADILHNAFMQGYIQDKQILDLGTGTGIFAVGAALLGAEVTAIDKDKEALEIAKKNSESASVSEFIEFVEEDISGVKEDYDTVLMNPPFSVHSDEGMKFLKKALKSSETVYSVIYGGNENAIREFVEGSNHEILAWEEYEISLPATYGFHTEESQDIEVGVLITSDIPS